VDFAAEERLAVFLECGHGFDGLAVEVEPLHERGELGIPCGHLRAAQHELADLVVFCCIYIFHSNTTGNQAGLSLYTFLLSRGRKEKKEKKRKKQRLVMGVLPFLQVGKAGSLVHTDCVPCW